ncbi:NUDIX domain-containing protein [Nocardia lijiangensis]|uniref:NUDIX domain-containing protein n=1 Tax=Nocardia lijiangensis TaxID=299618 RepID=UPI003D760391
MVSVAAGCHQRRGRTDHRRKGRVLLAQPSYKPEWIFVGGTVDAGESPRTALERELAEELRLLYETRRRWANSW